MTFRAILPTVPSFHVASPILNAALAMPVRAQADASVANWCGTSHPNANVPDVIIDPELEAPRDILTAEEMQKRFAGQTADWGHKYLEAGTAYAKTRGEGACIFVLDTGGKYDHPDLTDRVLGQYAKNFTTSKTLDDKHGHSTHCAGIAAASDNGLGVIGVAPGASLVPVKVLDDGGSGQYAWIASAIRYVADIEGLDKKKIISMSLGGGSTNKLVTDAIDYAISKGVFIVVAAGNSGYNGSDSVNFPGNYAPVVTVASLDKSGAVSSFSSGGPAVDVAAPGRDVYSTHLNGAYALMSGTSMATPHVAGVVALIVSAQTSITNQKQLEEYLTAKAKDLDPSGKDPRTGAGAPIVSAYFA